MKIELLRTAAFIFCLTIAPPLAAHGEDKQRQTPNLFGGMDTDAGKVVTGFHKALRSGDEQTLREHLHNDVLIFEGGKAERSLEEYASHHMKSDIKFLKQLQVEQLELQVTQRGEMAWSAGRTRSTGEYKGRKMDISGMESLVLRKVEGQWKIVYIHWSH
ncbi:MULTISPECIES: YybH family protein [Microbulbifer]|uniref:YybH family protein n=1 Tax=Microbulbifer TaxID=48073 RepID=UPI001CD4E3DA|nr:nuclear transport factor 2 family protein [Microbulbifer agarilyticus]MCA0900096.1 nuclear transport factor 2 family protein [Microbulbifer agarilyticus]